MSLALPVVFGSLCASDPSGSPSGSLSQAIISHPATIANSDHIYGARRTALETSDRRLVTFRTPCLARSTHPKYDETRTQLSGPADSDCPLAPCAALPSPHSYSFLRHFVPRVDHRPSIHRPTHCPLLSSSSLLRPWLPPRRLTTVHHRCRTVRFRQRLSIASRISLPWPRSQESAAALTHRGTVSHKSYRARSTALARPGRDLA